jgi:hypothetical protein
MHTSPHSTLRISVFALPRSPYLPSSEGKRTSPGQLWPTLKLLYVLPLSPTTIPSCFRMNLPPDSRSIQSSNIDPHRS